MTSRQPDRFTPMQTTASDIDLRSEVGSRNADVNNFIAKPQTLIGARHLNIFFVLGVALTLRLLFPLLGYLYTRDTTIFRGPDTESYVLPAQELITHHRFFSQGAPEVIRTPGYPFLLTIGLLLGHPDLVTILIQVMLSCFTVYVVYRTAQTLFKCERTSMTAAAMYAIEPLSILYTGGLLTETLFAALLMTGVYLLLVYLERRRIQYLLASAVVLAMSTYVRPIAYFLPVIIAAALSIWGLATVHDKNRVSFSHIAAFLSLSMVLTGVWQIRNKVETGYAGFSGISSIYKYFYLAASVLATQQHVPFVVMQHRLGYLDDELYLQQHPEQKKWTQGQRLDYLDEEASRIVLRNRLLYARTHVEGMIRMLFDPGAINFLKFFKLYPKSGGLLGKVVDKGLLATIVGLARNSPTVFWSNVLLVPFDLLYLACAGITLGSRRLRCDAATMIIVLITAYYIVISGGPNALGRFRHPVMPLMSVLAGYGFCVAWDRLRRLSYGVS